MVSYNTCFILISVLLLYPLCVKAMYRSSPRKSCTLTMYLLMNCSRATTGRSKAQTKLIDITMVGVLSRGGGATIAISGRNGERQQQPRKKERADRIFSISMCRLVVIIAKVSSIQSKSLFLPTWARLNINWQVILKGNSFWHKSRHSFDRLPYNLLHWVFSPFAPHLRNCHLLLCCDNSIPATVQSPSTKRRAINRFDSLSWRYQSVCRNFHSRGHEVWLGWWVAKVRWGCVFASFPLSVVWTKQSKMWSEHIVSYANFSRFQHQPRRNERREPPKDSIVCFMRNHLNWPTACLPACLFETTTEVRLPLIYPLSCIYRVVGKYALEIASNVWDVKGRK